ncbi:hypothetical protein SNEBB_001671 [Seison nebaliae]|nr:hypothetical protein SNEBB_001671 [Seison nebaliae]
MNSIEKICCRQCRSVICGEEAVIHHTSSLRREMKCDLNISINSPEYFQSTSEDNSGKLHCLKCNVKLGRFCWSGVKCECETWITPAFLLHQSKVDIYFSKRGDENQKEQMMNFEHERVQWEEMMNDHIDFMPTPLICTNDRELSLSKLIGSAENTVLPPAIPYLTTHQTNCIKNYLEHENYKKKLKEVNDQKSKSILKRLSTHQFSSAVGKSSLLAFQCRVCNYVSRQPPTIKSHIWKHTRNEQSCDRGYSYDETTTFMNCVTRHVASKKNVYSRSLIILSCNVCSFRTLDIQQWTSHLNSHQI